MICRTRKNRSQILLLFCGAEKFIPIRRLIRRIRCIIAGYNNFILIFMKCRLTILDQAHLECPIDEFVCIGHLYRGIRSFLYRCAMCNTTNYILHIIVTIISSIHRPVFILLHFQKDKADIVIVLRFILGTYDVSLSVTI